MKVIEPQSAVLSNAEVLSHLNNIASQRREQAGPSGVPPLKSANFETVIRELSAYLGPNNPAGATASSSNGTSAANWAAADHPLPPYEAQNPAVMGRLLERLAPYKLFKGETLMVLNLRPNDPVLLDLVVEGCDERYSAAQQEEIVAIIAEELGGPVQADEAEE